MTVSQLGYGVPDKELQRACRDLAAIVAAIPEADRGAWYASMSRFIRAHSDDPRQPYPYNKLGGCFLRLANACWPEYPPNSDG